MLVRSRRAWTACAIGLALLVTGCSADDGEPRAAVPTSSASSAPPPVPVPAGVRLTEPGSTLRVGRAAVAPYVAGQRREALVEVEVSGIRRGSADDFVGYQLDERTSRSTPWYVDASMTALGRGDLGRAPLPVFGYDSTDTFFPAAQVQGSFEPCPPVDATEELRRGDTVNGCLVFFVPPKARLEAVQLRAQDGVEEISWSIPPQHRSAAAGG